MIGEAEIKKIIQESIAETDIFIVEIKVIMGRIMVFLDKPTGITIQECARVCRNLLNTLEPEGILETTDVDVSSPGMDYPLRVLPQYHRYIGRAIKVKLQDGTEKDCTLLSADAMAIEVEETIIRKEGKKKVSETAQFVLPFEQIKEVKLIIKFK